MAKLKTNKSIVSRIRITGRKKLIRRASNQSHYNAKTSGNQRRLKRRTSCITSQDNKIFRRYSPYK